MEFFSTVDLRNKSSRLVELLQNGGSATLIHRSKIIGRIEPIQNVVSSKGKSDLKLLIDKLQLKLTSKMERQKRYREELNKKYDEDLS